MQSDAQGKFSSPKKASSPSSKTLLRFFNLPLVSRSIPFYNSFKSNHRIIAHVLGIIEWFYSPFFRKADHFLTYVEHKVNRGREKLYDYCDRILYYPVLLAEGSLVYYVDSLRQIFIARRAFQLIDSFTDLIVPIELERDVSDFQYQFFQNLEGNFPFLRKIRRKANIRAVWNLPKTLFFFAINCVDSLFSSLSYVFYLLFIAGSPQEKSRYLRPRSNISRKASLGPVSSFSSKTIPIILVTPPKLSTPTTKSEPNSNSASSSSLKTETKPIPQNQKRRKDFSRKKTLTKGTSLHNFLTREQLLGKLPPIKEEEPGIQVSKGSVDFNRNSLQSDNQYQGPKEPTQPIQPSDLNEPQACIKETLSNDLYEKVAEPKAHKQSDFIDNEDLEEDDDFVFNTNVSRYGFTSFGVFEAKNVDFIKEEEKDDFLENESRESIEQETVESDVIDPQDPEEFPSLPKKQKKSYSDIVNKLTENLFSQKAQKKNAANSTRKESKSTVPSKREREGKYIEEEEEHRETHKETDDWVTVSEHKHPHIPHLKKENITKLADSNPYAILHEVFNKEEEQKTENKVEQTTSQTITEIEVKEVEEIAEVIEFQPKQKNEWEVVHEGTAPHFKREKITDLADDSNPFALLDEEKLDEIELVKGSAPQKTEVKKELQERIDMQNTKDKIIDLLELNPFALLHEVFNDGTENHTEKFEPNSCDNTYETYETPNETDDWVTVPEHKHPHIPHLIKEELKEIADSNPYAILHEVFNKETSEEETIAQPAGTEIEQNETHDTLGDKRKIVSVSKNVSDKSEVQKLFLGYLEKSRRDAYSRLCLIKCVEEGERLRRMLKYRDVSLFNVDMKSCPNEEFVGELKQKRIELALAQAEYRAENMVNDALRKLRSAQDLQKVRDMVEEERFQQITLQNIYKEISDLERKITLNLVIKMEEEERQRRVDEMRSKNSGPLFSDKITEPKTFEQLQYVGGACF